MLFLKRAEEALQVSPDWVVISNVAASIHTELSAPVTPLKPLMATVPLTERFLHGVLELMPVKRLLAPLPLVIVNAAFVERLVEDAMLKDLLVER